jgi:Bacterial SH3 domain
MDNLNNPTSNSDQNIHEFFRGLLTERDAKLRVLTDEIAQLRAVNADQNLPKSTAETAELTTLLGDLRSENELMQSRFSQEKATLIQQLASQDDELQKLREERTISTNFVALKPTNSGKVAWSKVFLLMLLSGLSCFFVAKNLFKTATPTQAMFEKYRDQRLFQFEYDINQGQFAKVEAVLDKDLADKSYAQIAPQIEVLRKITRASNHFLSENGDKTGKYVSVSDKSQTPDPAENLPKGKEKTLTINNDVPVTLRHEATTTSESLAKLKKGTVCKVLDRTTTRDKVRTTIEENRYELRDYWYKIEAEDKTGWVFGFFTTRSQNIKLLLDSAGEPVVPAKTEAAKTEIAPN